MNSHLRVRLVGQRGSGPQLHPESIGGSNNAPAGSDHVPPLAELDDVFTAVRPAMLPNPLNCDAISLGDGAAMAR